jgi:hypothetical protein
MTSSIKLINANLAVAERREMIGVLTSPEPLAVIGMLYRRGVMSSESLTEFFEWPTEIVESTLAKLLEVKAVKKLGPSYELAEFVRRRLDLATRLDFLIGSELTGTGVSHPLRDTYSIESTIGRGASSITFLARQASTHKARALKVFLPNVVTYQELDDALITRSEIRSDALPDIVDAGEVRVDAPDGSTISLVSVVSDFVGESQTFEQFFTNQENPNRKILERFIERVGRALSSIEAVGLHHGDLHDGNILVREGTTGDVEFWVIDFIGVPKIASPGLQAVSDIQNFRDHLLRAAIIFGERYPGYSARNYLGERVYRVLHGLRTDAYNSFKSMLEDYDRPATIVPSTFFEAPKPRPFEWLRVEFFPSPEMLFKLFQPFQKRFEILNRFGNNWVSGPRGSGKSHYLRVLAFHPQAIVASERDPNLKKRFDELGYDFRNFFGVLFACRLGEFKMYVPEALGVTSFDDATQAFLKHLLVLKIWNKTFDAIYQGLDTLKHDGFPVLICPDTFADLIAFMEKSIGQMSILEAVDSKEIFRQIYLACTARENAATSTWHLPERRSAFKLLDERDLDSFFGTLRKTFSDLQLARFFILVDDASEGQVHFELQKILNSFVRSIQANHCFKITFDKYMYTLDTSDGRTLDTHNEGTYIDLGETVSPTQRGKREELSDYMASVIDLRLNEAGYVHNIREILGESQSVTDFLSALSQPRAHRVKGHKDRKQRNRAYYAGWNIIFSISHGSVRTLLELIEYIFKNNSVTMETPRISLDNQDTSVRSYSTSRNKQILMLPGVFDQEPLGNQLQAVLAAIGAVSRQYL